MSNDLLKQIDELVASKTFNLDALDGIKKLKDDLKKTLDDRDMLNKLNVGLSDTVRDLTHKLNAATEHSTKLENDLELSEAYRAKARESIYESEKHKAVAEAWKEAMQTVFKPHTVRETAWQAIPVSQSVNGNTYVNTYQQETKTTKEEL